MPELAEHMISSTHYYGAECVSLDLPGSVTGHDDAFLLILHI